MLLLAFGVGTVFGMWIQYKRFNGLYDGLRSALSRAKQFNDFAKSKLEDMDAVSSRPILEMPAPEIPNTVAGDLDRMIAGGRRLFRS